MGVLGCLPVRDMQEHVGATSTRGNRANFKVHVRKITQNYDADQKNSFLTLLAQRKSSGRSMQLLYLTYVYAFSQINLF